MLKTKEYLLLSYLKPSTSSVVIHYTTSSSSLLLSKDYLQPNTSHLLPPYTMASSPPNLHLKGLPWNESSTPFPHKNLKLWYIQTSHTTENIQLCNLLLPKSCLPCSECFHQFLFHTNRTLQSTDNLLLSTGHLVPVFPPSKLFATVRNFIILYNSSTGKFLPAELQAKLICIFNSFRVECHSH